jgi:UDPglucose 6-dehydrogenase
MRVTIFGSGYVGLVTGSCLADAGNHVLCVDIDDGKVDRLKRGELPIYEPGLEPMVKRCREAGRLDFTTDVAAGVAHGLFQFIAVGTPQDEDGSADLQHVLAVARSIGEHLGDYRIVVDKSTVPVGTADRVKAEIQAVLDERGAAVEFDVVSNPELLHVLYEPFNRNHDRMILMDVRSAELTKYAANAMLATKISFMNELANVAERVGADIEDVRVGIGSDPRIGYGFIYPGCGYGGSCFPKDVKALAAASRSAGYHSELLHAVESVNERQKQVLYNKIHTHFQGQLAGKTFAVWGLAFKPNTDDMREASSRRLLEALWHSNAIVRAYDPVAMDEARRLYGEREDLVLCERAEDALAGADALAIVTEWREFRSPDFDLIKSTLKQPVIFDGRNIYDPKLMEHAGIVYYGIGRGESINSEASEDFVMRGVS